MKSFFTCLFLCLFSGWAVGQINTFPYVENFDTFPVDNVTFGPGAEPNPFPNNWDNVQADAANQDWYGRSVATGSSGTGPTADHTSGSGVYVFVEDGWGNNTDVTLESPQFDFTNVSSAQLSYWANSYTGASSNFNEMHLDVFFNGAWVNDIDVFDDLTANNQWVQRFVDVSPYTGGIVRFRFRGDNSGQSFQHDIAIDDFMIEETVLTATIGGVVDIDCNGDSTGSMWVNVSFGSMPYTYSWSNGDTLDSLIGVPAGVYCVTVTDSVGDSVVVCDTIVENMAIVSVLGTNSPILACFGDTNGSAFIDSVSGGIPLNPDCGLAQLACSGPLDTFQLGVGTVTNTTTGYPAPYGNWYWGARHQLLYTAAELNAMGIFAGNISGLAFDVTQINGTSTYSNWRISMGCTQQTDLATAWATGLVQVLAPGTHTVTTGWNWHAFDTAYQWDGVTNLVVEVCFNNSGFTNNSASPYSVTPNTSVRYYRADNATVCSSTTVTGTSSNRPNILFEVCPIAPTPYTYAWSNGSTADSTGGLMGGPQIVTITDGLGCEHTDTVMIAQPPQLVPTVSGMDVSCNGFADGWAAVSIAGGTAPYSISWSNLATTDTVMNLGADSLVATITDANGCTAVSGSVIIFEPDPLVAAINDFVDVTCVGGNDGEATVLATGGVGNYTYDWSPQSQTGATATGLAGGMHTATVTDSNGCTATASVTLAELNPLPTSNLGPDTIICNDNPFTVIADPGFFYSWNLNPANNNQFYVVDGNTNTVGTPFDLIVFLSDVNGCENSDTINITIADCLGIDQLGEEVEVNFYPNPSNGQFNVEVSGLRSKDLQVNVFNAQGQMVHTENWVDLAPSFIRTIDLTGQAAGLYMIQMSSEYGSAVSRVTVE